MKKLFVCFVVCSFSLFIGFNSGRTNARAEVFLDNIEALATCGYAMLSFDKHPAKPTN